MATSHTPLEFVNELANFGVKPLLPPESIIYKYASLETAIKIIESNSLLFSPPTSFNDPFDLTNGLVDGSFTESNLKIWLDSFTHLSTEDKQTLFEANLKEPAKMIEMFDNVLTTFKKSAGITCFSKSYKKTLMWSHYADKHAGICLGFNIIPIGMKKFTLLEVNYVDKIVPLNYFEKKHFALLYWLYTKSKVWEYEEEVRAVYQDVNGFIEFDKRLLRQIHFGLRTTKELRDKFNMLLSKLKYNLDKSTVMEMDPTTFDLKEALI